VGGYISGSIAVISDAFHLVTDLIGFGISFFFIYFSRKEPTEKMSFGFHRMEIIGALANLFIIWFLAIFMIYEATDRIIHK
jgi:zinc transporter 2